MQAESKTEGERGRERKTDRKTDRQTGRQTDRQTDTQADRQTDRQKGEKKRIHICLSQPRHHWGTSSDRLCSHGDQYKMAASSRKPREGRNQKIEKRNHHHFPEVRNVVYRDIPTNNPPLDSGIPPCSFAAVHCTGDDIYLRVRAVLSAYHNAFTMTIRYLHWLFRRG